MPKLVRGFGWSWEKLEERGSGDSVIDSITFRSVFFLNAALEQSPGFDRNFVLIYVKLFPTSLEDVTNRFE